MQPSLFVVERRRSHCAEAGHLKVGGGLRHVREPAMRQHSSVAVIPVWEAALIGLTLAPQARYGV